MDESYSSNSDTEYSGSEESDFDMCCSRESNSCGLPFDPTSLENVILSISDRFNFRIMLSDGRVKNAMLITTGLSLAGSLIGRHYGGKVGAAVGGAVGGVCGLGVVAVSMREIWQEIKGQLAELFDVVYDYLAGLGVEDYTAAAKFLLKHGGNSTQLALLIVQVTSDILGKQVLSSLTAA